MGHSVYEKSRLPLIATPIVSKKPSPSVPQQGVSNGYESDVQQQYDTETGGYPHQISDAAMHDTPQFQRHEEATNAELFYDLFFVANLTTFTSIHEINQSDALISYSGFFCLLWFTWCQVSLFDVRYVTDSLVERITKSCQFGVMVGFAVVGPNFDPRNQKQSTFRALSLILAVSRFVLSLQYLMVMFHVREYRKSKTSLGLLSLLSFIAALIYLGVTFAFKKDQNGHVYAIWYVVAVLETAINIALSSNWKVVSFKGTHLVQRMSLLTLIILGEGIIVVCKSISKIVTNEFAWSSGTIGSITATIAIIYFLYLLYFDWLSDYHFGSIRQQIWVFLHFPFHISLVLALEGSAQFVIWRNLVEIREKLSKTFHKALEGSSVDDTPDLVRKLNTTTQLVFSYYPPKDTKIINEVDDALGLIVASKDRNTTMEAVDQLFAAIENSLISSYGIEPPKDKYDTPTSPLAKVDKYHHIFFLVTIYFFISIGIVLVIMNLLHYISISHKSSPKLSKGYGSASSSSPSLGSASARLLFWPLVVPGEILLQVLGCYQLWHLLFYVSCWSISWGKGKAVILMRSIDLLFCQNDKEP